MTPNYMCMKAFKHIQNYSKRADAIRYFLLQTYGGLYTDLDFECLTPKFTTLLEEADFVAGRAPDEHARRCGVPYIICNALIASVPDNTFLEHVIQRIMNHPHGWNVCSVADIINSTGPMLLTDSYDDYAEKSGIRIIESWLLYPVRLGEGIHILKKQVPEEMGQRINEAYAMHYFWCTWWY